ncbi:alpha-glucan family phosphorylase [Fuchsiella alkaliacetigena]|uniref:alpha-glucan family phosphorylase n=1 Tax=Fuchsiella alkaliacetigena TaxID=957042 RepID=UPI00200B73F7|nr:alpha-glucan family phosphorylase [Fuchsiella alkaliacetigena]MCK8823886.1 alpha-glucan family phosphorylase [Fuchsiella alkaliacetigena]
MENKAEVAYFCMEYGLNEELPIYSGGLGVLAGDHLKAAADLNKPLIGIGILWRQNYTQQYIGDDGRPYDTYPNFDYDFLKDTGIKVKVQIKGEEVEAKVRLVDQYENAPLYLLDTNFPGSEYGWITNQLYGGNEEDRVAQEILLGVGGIKLLRKLGIEVDKYHFNEGHAVFAGLELIREKMEAENLSFSEARKAIRPQIVFTTHTPVRAGNEVYDHQFLEYMQAYNGFDYQQMCEIGGDPFNMTVAGLRLSSIANGVSELHGETTKEMWDEVTDSAPIVAITNGVHSRTWQHESIRRAYEEEADLWEPHFRLKEDLVNFVRERNGANLDPESLIVGFARRKAPYKRSELIFRNADAIDPLLQEGKLQLIFSGKAHPKDETGKDIVENLVEMDRKYENSVVFLENYDMEIARKLVQGADVWLNNPRRPLEASGTSGMKAAMNGVLNLSVVDGWLAEGPEHEVSGWLIDEVLEEDYNHLSEDQRDLKALYKVIYDEVIPTYYENHEKWKEMMRASIDMSHWQFSAQRMVEEYYERMYSFEQSSRDQEGISIDKLNPIEVVSPPQQRV